jgi:hypothetical protein
MRWSVRRGVDCSGRNQVSLRGRATRRMVLSSAVLVVVTAGPAQAADVWAVDTPLDRVQGTGLLFWIAGLSLLIAMLWFIPVFYDARQANKWRAGRQADIIRELIEAASKDRRGLSVEDVRQLVSAMDRSPRGANGLTSSLLALLIVLLVAIAMLVSLLSSDADAGDLRKTIVTSLLAVLATISGFYFGARTAQTSTEQATKPPEARSGRGDYTPLPDRGGQPAATGDTTEADEAAGRRADDEPSTAPESLPATSAAPPVPADGSSNVPEGDVRDRPDEPGATSPPDRI